MSYSYRERKIVALLAENLEPWQAMNTLGHMAITLGVNKDSYLMGREILLDKNGIKHPGIARYGFVIKKTDSTSIAETIKAAKNNENITTIDFPREMLDMGHDDELVESIQNKNSDDFEYLGVLLYGITDDIDLLTKKFKLWS